MKFLLLADPNFSILELNISAVSARFSVNFAIKTNFRVYDVLL